MARPSKTIIDSIKTIVWFNFIAQTTGMNPNILEKKLNENQASGGGSNKCYRWKYGIRTPSKTNVTRVEKIAQGSSKLFDHPLWEILNKPTSIRTLMDVERLLIRLPEPKYVLFKRAQSSSEKMVRVARPIDLETAYELRYFGNPNQIYLANDLQNLDLMAAYLLFAIEANILGSRNGLIVALNLFKESKPQIRKIPELKGVVEQLLKYIESSSEWAYPGPVENSEHDTFMRELQLGLGLDTDPSYQWIPEQDALLGTMPDEVLAERLCIPKGTVWYRRYQLGVFEYFERN